MDERDTVRAAPPARPLRAIRIEVLEGPDRGRSFDASEERIQIGTASTNDLVLTDEAVSRYHLELLHRGERVDLIDHDSTNGTWIGTAAIKRGFLLPGTVLKVGRSLLRVTDGDPIELPLHEDDRLGGLVGRSVAMRQLMARMRKVAASSASVLLLGETGAGKDSVARAIHEASPRAGGPFESVDCGSMVDTLITTELFGHERGAFTGAYAQHLGAFERARGGTLFLDEVGELPLNLQAALLGTLERRSFRRIGGSERIDTDVRVICATHRDLRAAVNSGGFRQELFFRIAVVVLDIPPLRERRDDVPVLIEHFVRRAHRSEPVEQLFPPDMLAALASQEWPGNVRELRNFVEATLAMGVPPELSSSERPIADSDERGASAQFVDLAPLLELPHEQARGEMIERFEKAYLRALLNRSGGRVNAAARDARMDRTYLGRLLKRHGFALKARPGDDGEA
ncbi:MAG: sigma 54-dependent Fis family transcriptional regulator [Deltaproteobacteria bacterium]|nr:sigma 54-dependent Fis family transcriptional regulator [Deltaproteobacteria bacterium]